MRPEIGDGWSLDVPDGFETAREEDGTWVGWDERRTVRCMTVSTSGRADGTPVSADQMLSGRRAAGWGEEWRRQGLVSVAEQVFVDEDGGHWELRTATAMQNRLLSCWIAYRSPLFESWARQVWESISNTSG